MPPPGRGKKCPRCQSLTIYSEGNGVWFCSQGDFVGFKLDAGWSKASPTARRGYRCFICETQTLHQAGETIAGVPKFVCTSCRLHGFMLPIWRGP
jgi:DNA-directed RNA polymerase subunit RPC12/RpoP